MASASLTAHQQLVKRFGVALTGGIATGKSTVASLIRRAGYLVIDADQLSRATTAPGSPGLAQLTQVFGSDILDADGALDRQRLGALVFADPARRHTLEAITHPLIRKALGERLEAEGLIARPRPFFYEAALIIETGTAADFQAVWATVCPPDLQRQRLMARNQISGEAADRIIASQMPAAAKAARAQVVFDTAKPLAELTSEVQERLRQLTASAVAHVTP